MKKLEKLIKVSTLETYLSFDETATLEKLVGLLNVKGSKMGSKLSILRTKECDQITVTISNAVTYIFDNEEELQKFLNKNFEKYDTEKQMYQEFFGMDDETWEAWNEGN